MCNLIPMWIYLLNFEVNFETKGGLWNNMDYIIGAPAEKCGSQDARKREYPRMKYVKWIVLA